MSNIPLNLQFFAEPDTTTTPPAATPPASMPAALNPNDFANAFVKALDDRTQRAEKGVLKSMAEQYGVSEDEAKTVLEKYKSDKAATLPEAAQAKIKEATDKANGLLLAAEVKTLGASYGLVDADVALQLLDKTNIKIDDKGVVTGVKEAIEALKESKPYLFGAKTGAMAQKIGGQSAGTLSAVEERFYAKNPNLRPK